MRKFNRLLSLLLLAYCLLSGSVACSEQAENKVLNSHVSNVTVHSNSAKSSNEKSQESSKNMESNIEPIVSDGDSNHWDFEVQDLSGQTYHLKSYFSQYDYTLVNIWATFCGPCKIELPELQKISEDFAEQNIAVAGMALDVFADNRETVDLAKSIFEESGVTYISFVSNQDLENTIFQEVYAVPTTLLIDSNGNIAAAPIVGAQNYDVFAEALHNVSKN